MRQLIVTGMLLVPLLVGVAVLGGGAVLAAAVVVFLVLVWGFDLLGRAMVKRVDDERVRRSKG